jgi:hypothetical protein
MPGWHVATAAEAIAAAQFARLGCDVSVQYGANQPEYDLMIARGERMLKISVKGSSDGGWGISQSQLSKLRKDNPTGKTDYHAAADMWLARHARRTAMCFVNFRDVSIDAMPRVYLLWPKDVAKLLKRARNGRGDTRLYDLRLKPRPNHAVVSSDWVLTADRLNAMLGQTREAAN